MDRNTPPPQYSDMPLPDLLRQLSTDTATLVRQEVQLARAEVSEKGKKVAKSATGFGLAAIMALGAFGAITTMLIALLALVLQVWAAALIVAVVYGIVAFIGLQTGKKALVDITPAVPQTVDSLKEDVNAVRAGVQRGR